MSCPFKYVYKYFVKTKFEKIPFSRTSIYIYRLENKYGEGPYRNNFKPKINNNNSENRPSPWDDIREFELLEKCDYNYIYRFGFLQKEDAYIWFSKRELKHLKKYGFRLTVYKTDEYLIGTSHKQLVFNKSSSVFIRNEKIIIKAKSLKEKLLKYKTKDKNVIDL